MKWIFGLLLTIQAFAVNADLNYYLGSDSSYSAATPKPAEVLRFQPGEQHARPEQLLHYYETLAAQSDRVVVLETGKTHEQRPLLLVFISSSENIKNLESIRQQHLSGDENAPMVTWLGFSIHGNEPSGANAAPVVAYHFTAGESQEVLDTLNDQIIIIDPMLNPDGLSRFAHWANMYKGNIQNPNPQTMELNESWPRGRTNHYWFDLNRDWLPVQHPESVARVTQFQKWRPHVLTDHHEMGTDKTFFFQPGVVTRQHPLTDPENFRMTDTISRFHAKALDKLGTLYYSKEGYDDFYYGKGATYPDPQGGVGILFEQASVRGHAQQTPYGIRTFPEAIRNQFTVALSTVEAVHNNQNELRAMRQSSIKTSTQMVEADGDAGVILWTADSYRMREFERILNMHKIEFFSTDADSKIAGINYARGSLVVPYDQAQYRLVKSLFENRKEFTDKVFYDVSTWNMAHAFDLGYDFLSERQLRSLNSQDNKPQLNQLSTTGAIALAMDWRNMGAAKALSLLLQSDITSVAVTKPTELVTSTGNIALSLGSIIVPLSTEPAKRAQTIQSVVSIAREAKVELIAVETGLASSGVDVGSPSLKPVPKVRPLLLVGDGIRSYDAGEAWHFLDQRLSQSVTLVTLSQLNGMSNLGDYTHLLMPDGSYRFTDAQRNKLHQWVVAGGNVIATSRAAEWLVEQDWMSSENKQFNPVTDVTARYADKGQIDAANVVGGAIAAGSVDTSHPLGFGLDDEDISFYKRGSRVFTEPREAFVAIARFKENAHRSGYMSEAVADHLSGSPSVLVQRLGQGKLIAFSDNPLFRAYWLGTMRLYANALYFSPLINAPSATAKPK